MSTYHPSLDSQDHWSDVACFIFVRPPSLSLWNLPPTLPTDMTADLKMITLETLSWHSAENIALFWKIGILVFALMACGWERCQLRLVMHLSWLGVLLCWKAMCLINVINEPVRSLLKSQWERYTYAHTVYHVLEVCMWTNGQMVRHSFRQT